MHVPLFDTATGLLPMRGEVDQAIASVLDSGRFVLGPQVSAFEREFADYVGTEFGVGVGNGTDALTIALRALGVGPGDDVVVPSFTFYASAEAIPPTGARPVFCDVDPQTMNVTRETIEAALTPDTKAVVIVHLFGSPAPAAAIMELARERGIKVLEDAAQAAGATLGGVKAGALGDAATFSFFPSKNLGCFGDGGMITTSDPAVARMAKRLRLHGSTDKSSYGEIGYNSRLDEIQAAILRVLLPKLDEWNDARRQAADWYGELGVGDFATPQAHVDGAEPVFHLYVVRLDNPDGVAAALRGSRVEARGYYRQAVHEQPAMVAFKAQTALPGTDRAAAHNLALPMSPAITRVQVKAVVAALREAHLTFADADLG